MKLVYHSRNLALTSQHQIQQLQTNHSCMFISRAADSSHPCEFITFGFPLAKCSLLSLHYETSRIYARYLGPFMKPFSHHQAPDLCTLNYRIVDGNKIQFIRIKLQKNCKMCKNKSFNTKFIIFDTFHEKPAALDK